MPPKKKSAATQSAKLPVKERVKFALEWLDAKSTDHDRKNMVKFAISAKKFFGVSMANMKVLAKKLGHDHELAAELWKSGWYEARMVASMVDEPEQVSPTQMDQWVNDFDNWGICDTVCFCLFDRTPHAWKKVTQWAGKREEFVKRTAFALLWSLTTHDKESDNTPFLDGLKLIEQAATDERHFVKKAVNMALRAVGKRTPALNAAAVKVAKRLAESDDPTPRWIGKDALRELESAKIKAGLARRAK